MINADAEKKLLLYCFIARFIRQFEAVIYLEPPGGNIFLLATLQHEKMQLFYRGTEKQRFSKNSDTFEGRLLRSV